MKYHNVDVVLKLDMGVGIGGDKWPAAELFCTVVSDKKHLGTFSSVFDGKRVIELGSGTGLGGGIVVDKLFMPFKVLVTDLLSHVPHMDINWNLNPDANHCKAIELDWGNGSYDIGVFDVVLAFECVFKPEMYEPFIKTLRNLSTHSTVVILGMTRQFLQPRFFRPGLCTCERY